MQKEALERGVKRMNRSRSASVRIQEIWIREEPLPKTMTGKLRRFLLEQEYQAKREKAGDRKTV